MKNAIIRLIGFGLNILAWISPRMAGKKGYYLFCTPRRTPLQDHQRKFLETATRFNFDFEGTSIQGYQWGTGKKKLLFLHGWQSHSFRWKNYIDAFSRSELTIYAFDAPAHGLSAGKYLNLPIYSRVIDQFLAAHEIDTIISHSVGSFAALYSFYKNPSLPVKKLVITASPGEASEFVKVYENTLGLSERSLRAIRLFFEELIGHPPEYFSAHQFAASVPVRGLIIHDEYDEDAPYHHALDIHHAWKKSELITTSGLGHNLRSASVIKSVVDFVDETEVRMKKVQHAAGTIPLAGTNN